MGNNPSRAANASSPATHSPVNTPNTNTPRRQGSQRRQRTDHNISQYLASQGQGNSQNAARRHASTEPEAPVGRSRAISQPPEHMMHVGGGGVGGNTGGGSPSTLQWLPAPSYAPNGRKGSLPITAMYGDQSPNLPAIASTPVGPSVDRTPSQRHTPQMQPQHSLFPHSASIHSDVPPTIAMSSTGGGMGTGSGSTGAGPFAAGMDVPPSAPLHPLKRKSSMASNSTVEEDELDLNESKIVPTEVRWTEGGTKVYVTGTFAGWRKKYKLTKNSEEGNVMSAVVPLPPGTHHIAFIVDDQMQVSQHLPTAVDQNGILVNYFEVTSDELPPLDRMPSPTAGGDPGDGSTQTGTSLAESESAVDQSVQPGGQRPPINRASSKTYTSEIPAYLRELEERQDRYGNRAYEIPVESPPSLPLLLGKVILNSTAAMKEDNSVLSIPNHVVLNHLATSSIKAGVLAVSATTRYRKKYVTTILYKATSDKSS
ncbi:AMPKBI-domain-containing protein [Ascobolus immersus RN42]|uniref:AMPKBI-domain-containing protein n=1 Tax=Ascobolus immersus RN42 TaxID=1160509 RepID=A0A3N4IHZ7_ASCIM|nr:AMPKBI-domain-containing protein [Ascobolus immersus RN42]